MRRVHTGQAARQGSYARHVWSPWYLLGHTICAWELGEQLGRGAPDALLCPVGQGNLFLGLARAYLKPNATVVLLLTGSGLKLI